MTQAQDRQFVTERRLDPALDPPEYKDVELPTMSVKLQGALRRSRERAPHGTVFGSLRLTGSFHELGKGTASLRVTRLSLFSGSRNNAWHIRHSRDGTVDVIDFEAPGQHVLLGNALEPIYSFGPGSITWGWLGNSAGSIGSAHNVSQSMEGLLG